MSAGRGNSAATCQGHHTTRAGGDAGPGNAGGTRPGRCGAGRQAQSRAPQQLGPVITHPERRERKPAERAAAGGGRRANRAAEPDGPRADKGLGGSRAPRRRRPRDVGPPGQASQRGRRGFRTLRAPVGPPLPPVLPARRGQRCAAHWAVFLPGPRGTGAWGGEQGPPLGRHPGRGGSGSPLFVPLLWAKRGVQPQKRGATALHPRFPHPRKPGPHVPRESGDTLPVPRFVAQTLHRQAGPAGQGSGPGVGRAAPLPSWGSPDLLSPRCLRTRPAVTTTVTTSPAGARRCAARSVPSRIRSHFADLPQFRPFIFRGRAACTDPLH